MTEKRVDRTQSPDPDKPRVTDPTASNAAAGPALTGTGLSTPALAPAAGQPVGGQGRVDVTGIVPEGIHIDPDITEGHPGYEESGDSEIIPLERLARGETAGREDRDSGEIV